MPNKPDLETLPGNPMRQSATLGHLIGDVVFFRQAHKKIKPDWFHDRLHSQIYQIFLDLYAKSGTFPTAEEFRTDAAFDPLDKVHRAALGASIDRARQDAATIRLSQIRPGLTQWLHTKFLQDGMVRAARSFNEGRIPEAAALLEETSRSVREIQFDEGGQISFADPKSWLHEAETNKKGTITTGLYVLDRGLLDLTVDEQKKVDELRAKNLFPEQPGGLQLGDTTVIMAPSNGGKTTALITMAVHNLKQSKHVLWMSHEGRPSDIRMKFLQSYLELTGPELLDLYKTPQGLSKIEAAAVNLEKFLMYVPYNKAGMKVEDVVAIIRRLQDECSIRRATLYGCDDRRGFDLLVSDYPAKLSTELAAKGNLPTRNILDQVYDQYVQLALEYDFHSLLAIQSNRDASKRNSGVYDNKETEHRLLTMEDVSEAWGPMTSATNVITLNRSPTDQLANRITFYIAKSRSSRTGLAVVANSRFGRSQTHSEELGALCYYGTMSMEGKIGGYLTNFKSLPNGFIPQEVLYMQSSK